MRDAKENLYLQLPMAFKLGPKRLQCDEELQLRRVWAVRHAECHFHLRYVQQQRLRQLLFWVFGQQQ